ncbi:MAG: tRNA (adenosine(37)-N6)-dimethylallyltransferase MiaA [Gemmatimonadota bacterium]
MSRPRFLAITGTTASGKTDLSLALAADCDVEIVSMDSRQVYTGMDVGTDKVSAEGRLVVPHHGLDLVAPDQRYSAGQFARDVREWIDEIADRGRLPLLVGGTGFFLRAVLEPLFAEPAVDEERRMRLRRWLGRLDRAELERFVRALDPDRAETAVEGGPQRMARTIEIALLTGRSLSWWHAQDRSDGDGVPGVVVLLDLPRAATVESINGRVDRMVERGLVDEVRSLLSQGYSDADPGMSGTGYREITSHLRGERTLEEAMEEIRVQTRRYARRQVTWFRHQLPDDAIRIDASEPLERQVERVRTAAAAAGLDLADFARSEHDG